MSEQAEPKFCKDCKHYNSSWTNYDGRFCATGCNHPNNLRLNLETGNQYPVLEPLRFREKECGEQGALFEARPPAPVIVFIDSPPPPRRESWVKRLLGGRL